MANLIKRDGVFYIEFYAKGRRIRRSLKTSSKGVATKRKVAIEQQIAANQFGISRHNPSVESFTKEYLEWAARHKAANTVKKDEMWLRHVVEFSGARRIGDITPDVVERFKKDRQDRGLKSSSINDALRHLKSVFNRGAKLGLHSVPNPVIGTRFLRIEKAPPKFLSSQEVEQLLETAQGQSQEILMFCALGLYAGLRRMEIVNARWEWFDFERKLVCVQAGEAFTLKSHEYRTIPLNAKLAVLLSPFRRESGYLIRPEKNSGQYVYRVELQKAFKAVVRTDGLGWVTAHVLRHTFASRLAQANVSLYKISKWLGHKDLKTTQVYAHLQTYDEAIDVL